MLKLRVFFISFVLLNLSACLSSGGGDTASNSNTLTTSAVTDSSVVVVSDAEKKSLQLSLGKQIFFDKNLSSPAGQACASCHDPKTGFADPNQSNPTSQGVHKERFGNRNTPTMAYASFTPTFTFDEKEQSYVGGLFLDGRAPTLAEQAKGPFLNLVEMANPNKESVVTKVSQAEYASLFKKIYGEQAFLDNEKAYDQIAEAITVFEQSSEVNAFSSKYDYFLAGKVALTDQELLGMQLFIAPNKGNCAACHPAEKAADGSPPLFTDYTYDNLGVPKNTKSQFLHQPKEFNERGEDFIDLGLGGSAQVNNHEYNGQFKVPTLRNVALTAPYMHNGIFSSLREVMDFYNTRDVDPKWAAPEVPENVNRTELGNLGLTAQEVDALVAFMNTLTDGYVVQQ
jgi:cytochrome c peroxidase